MLKKELKEFQAVADKDVLDFACFPALLSALTRSETSAVALETAAEEKRRMMRPLSLHATVTIPEPMRGFRGRALCLSGLLGHCSVWLDEKKVGEWRSPPETVYVAISDPKESFSLEIRFPARTVPMDVGVLGGVELIAFSHDVISDVYTEQIHKNGKCELFVRVRTLCTDADEAFATLYSPSGEIHYLGLVHGEGRIVLPTPQRYRPTGAGIAGLYRLVVTLYCNGLPTDSRETRIGFRKVTFSKDGGAQPFAAMLDDTPYFIKAARTSANPALSATKNMLFFEHALRSFVKMGGNTLWVTPESGFLCDRVYETCDRLGMLVFQQIPLPDAQTDLTAYFTELKTGLSPLLNHPSLAMILLPDGVSAASELGRSIKSFFSLTFPCVSVCGVPAVGFPDIAKVSSMPSALAVRRNLPMEARHIFSYAMESAQDAPGQLVSMLATAAQELPYGAGLEDVCYVTAVSSAEAAQKAFAEALEHGVPGGAVVGTLFEGQISMQPSLLDCLLSGKTLYYDLRKFFSPIFVQVQAKEQGATVCLATASSTPIGVRVVTSLMDRSNRRISRMQDDCTLAAGAPLILKKAFADIPGHEREYYVLASVYAEEKLLCEKTALFVPAKHFRFAYPGLQFEIKGGGKNYEIALSASAYVRRLQLSFTKTAARFEKNYFDIVSDTKILLSVETEEVTTSRHLESQLRLRSLYDVGQITERELSDETDFES